MFLNVCSQVILYESPIPYTRICSNCAFIISDGIYTPNTQADLAARYPITEAIIMQESLRPFGQRNVNTDLCTGLKSLFIYNVQTQTDHGLNF